MVLRLTLVVTNQSPVAEAYLMVAPPVMLTRLENTAVINSLLYRTVI